ncbi:MAG: dTDP-4-dehydrorhamnose reductase [Pseudohongiellaceae bacterium]|jgi:dTDP-4-dehydrorhamnose reductase
MIEKPAIVITGAGGQLGLTLQQLWPASRLGQHYRLLPLTAAELDIADPMAIQSALDEQDVVAIVNAAAYNGVDAAEDDRDGAFRVNHKGPALLADWSAKNRSRLLHVSTDFVFDGDSKQPYQPDDDPLPLGVYGSSKLAGEEEIQERLPEASIIVRTSWLYSPFRANFLKTMLRLMKERDSLSVVADQIGSPTSTFSLAGLLLAVLQHESFTGIYHWSDGAAISWYEFAVAIQEEALAAGLLDRPIPIEPIATEQYPTPAARPAYSVLDPSRAETDFSFPHQDWRANLRAIVGHLAQAEAT